MGGKPEQCPQKGGGGGNEEKALSCFVGGFLVVSSEGFGLHRCMRLLTQQMYT